MSKKVRISLHNHGKLILFCLILLVGCVQSQDKSQSQITILWKNGQATGFSIPLHLLGSASKEIISTSIKVRLSKPGTPPAILGETTIHKEAFIFEPLIPFTAGLRYQIFADNRLLSEIEIPKSTEIPVLSGVYPTQDTLPENLLKFYFVFSRPMTEGHSLEYITLCNAQGDTLPRTFLNLQPELWNAERTILTLWLDPGRIKRDLQPNKMLGAPLTQGNLYTLKVSEHWPDAEGTTLPQNFTKNFVVTSRDMVSPKIDHWQLNIPKKGTTQPLEVNCHEPLDYILLQNAILIADDKGNFIAGTIQPDQEEKKFRFIPAVPWSGGQYTLQTEARLEDLAGNNLTRLFDRDVTDKGAKVSNQKLFERKWRID